MALQKYHLYSPFPRLLQSGSKGWVRIGIWPDSRDAIYLDYKSDSGSVTLCGGLCQLAEVLHAPLRRRIRKIANPVFFQRTALDLQQI